MAEQHIDQGSRYDRIGDGYARHWAPVLAPSALALLDRLAAVAPELTEAPGWIGDADPHGDGAVHLLDVGTGTGTLGRAIVARWPGVRVTGVDASTGMLAIARSTANATLPASDRRRFGTAEAFLDQLPFEDASVDGAVASFVLQLVPSRARALRELARVIRPGGWLAHVTWRRGGPDYPPDTIADTVFRELGLAGRDEDPGRSGDMASARAATAELRRAGFRRVRAEEAMLVHPWDPEGYAEFLEWFDEEDRFAAMEPPMRDRVRTLLRTRLSVLEPGDLVLRLPIVYALGRRG